jgi:8-oxo-dGTP pyrophosphatase MutT (NUDIX family)
MDALPPIQSAIRVEVSGSAGAVGGNVLSEDTAASTRWLRLCNVTYVLAKDGGTGAAPRKWDAAGRTTRSSTSVADAVVVFAKLYLSSGDDPRVLFVKQFRPPVNAVTVELPAGLIDAGESAGEAALRELKEETGFIGTVTRVSAPQCLSPGMSNETVVVVEVDVTAQEQQALDDSEEVEVVSVPLRRMGAALEWFVKEEGCVVMHAVATLAVGIETGLALSYAL